MYNSIREASFLRFTSVLNLCGWSSNYSHDLNPQYNIWTIYLIKYPIIIFLYLPSIVWIVLFLTVYINDKIYCYIWWANYCRNPACLIKFSELEKKISTNYWYLMQPQIGSFRYTLSRLHFQILKFFKFLR